jgi:hypothetical protein
LAEIAIAAAISAAVSAASYTLNYLLTPKPKPTEKNRLQGQVQVQSSAYGHMIPILLGGDPGDGTAHGFRIAANVTYLSAVRKTEEITSGTGGGGGQSGKGGGGSAPSEKSYHYFADIGLMFGTPLKGGELELLALYAGSDLIYDQRQGSSGSTGTYEAEDFSNTRTGACQVNDYASASFGKELTLQQSGGGAGNGACQFNSVFSYSAGLRDLEITYRTASGVAMPIELTVNGVTVSFTLPTTNESFGKHLRSITVQEGLNVIKIRNASPVYNLGLDRIYVYAGVAPAPGVPAPEPGVTPLPPPTGGIDPTFPPDPPYDPDFPFDPNDPERKEMPTRRYSFVSAPNARGEVSAQLVAGSYASLRWYPGTETQEVDPIIEQAYSDLPLNGDGSSNAPAYLGRAWAMLDNFEITKYGAIPNFTAIVRNRIYKTVAASLGALCEASGLESAEYDVSSLSEMKLRGMAIVNQSSVKQISEDTLAKRFPFDWTQKNGQIVAVARGGAVQYAIPDKHLGFIAGSAVEGQLAVNQPPQRIAVKLKMNDAELARRVEVKAFDPR